MIITWVVTRALMFAVLAAFESFIVGDVYYYHRKIVGLFEVGSARHLDGVPDPGGLDPDPAVRGGAG